MPQLHTDGPVGALCFAHALTATTQFSHTLTCHVATPCSLHELQHVDHAVDLAGDAVILMFPQCHQPVKCPELLHHSRHRVAGCLIILLRLRGSRVLTNHSIATCCCRFSCFLCSLLLPLLLGLPHHDLLALLDRVLQALNRHNQDVGRCAEVQEGHQLLNQAVVKQRKCHLGCHTDGGRPGVGEHVCALAAHAVLCRAHQCNDVTKHIGVHQRLHLLTCACCNV
mmetsp:Transcript_2329/g.5204  ORF Transcript_2329/g.5204 Transcript_2329/m.5204 type:complete len:225 (-) Transcript_2329:1592-2266(-)